MDHPYDATFREQHELKTVAGEVASPQAKQVGGSHYLKAIQPWDIIRAWGLGFHRGNIIKYVLRSPGKNGKEDLEKAKHYLDYLIANYDALKEEGIL